MARAEPRAAQPPWSSLEGADGARHTVPGDAARAPARQIGRPGRATRPARHPHPGQRGGSGGRGGVRWAAAVGGEPLAPLLPLGRDPRRAGRDHVRRGAPLRRRAAPRRGDAGRGGRWPRLLLHGRQRPRRARATRAARATGAAARRGGGDRPAPQPGGLRASGGPRLTWSTPPRRSTCSACGCGRSSRRRRRRSSSATLDTSSRPSGTGSAALTCGRCRAGGSAGCTATPRSGYSSGTRRSTGSQQHLSPKKSTTSWGRRSPCGGSKRRLYTPSISLA